MTTLLTLKLRSVESIATSVELAKQHTQASKKLAAFDKGNKCVMLTNLRTCFVKNVEGLETPLSIAELTTEVLKNINFVLKGS